MQACGKGGGGDLLLMERDLWQNQVGKGSHVLF